ncbi:hypothetical protein N7582_004818 [Saccharomyces uvarum]|uniref:Uncharacterized protein n=1 Tax=Saccharomyces uvarum TaxID=230603 RepID=A0AA35J7L9_SACUV|nr:hypothetical protein N7582_004818 [Saccharomyces uvarum]CAI4050047.1 hypothetical protein SUVC_14G1640 [Saccharomyces uvarum]
MQLARTQLSQWLFVLILLSSGFVHANTESILFQVPHNFPLSEVRDRFVPGSNDDSVPFISLLGEAMGQVTVMVNTTNAQLGSTTYIELKDLQRDETYQIKTCWSAIHPVSIDDLQTIIIPRSTEFQGTTSDHARIVVAFQMVPDSYPREHAMVPIQVSLITTKLAIPVDIYPILVVIVLLIAGLVVTRAPHVLNDLLLKF